MADMGARPAGSAGKKRGGLILFLAGIVVGVVAMVFGPRYLGDYLPGSIGGRTANVTGVVTRKLAEDTRLLLTVVTDSGAVLATFKDRTTEIDLLVEEGDSVTFALAAYAPFVDDPRLGRVVKPVGGTGESSSARAAAVAGSDAESGEPADTVGSSTVGREPDEAGPMGGAPAPDSAAATMEAADSALDRG